MSEYIFVEQPFLDQLAALGWAGRLLIWVRVSPEILPAVIGMISAKLFLRTIVL